MVVKAVMASLYIEVNKRKLFARGTIALGLRRIKPWSDLSKLWATLSKLKQNSLFRELAKPKCLVIGLFYLCT